MAATYPTLATETLRYDGAAIRHAASQIAAGQPVAVAAETVYGLAADATSGAAVARIYAAKGRPSFNPLIVHVASAAAQQIARFGGAADRLAAAFWPGSLTMVLPIASQSPIHPLVTAGLPTVAVRVPPACALGDLVNACGRPLAAPSANASGNISPTTAGHVLASLGGRIPLIVDSGPTQAGVESTIVAVEAGRLRLLRPGPIAAEALSDVARLPIAGDGTGGIKAPGQMASHYAPTRTLRLDTTRSKGDEWLIGFGAVDGDESLSPSGNLIEAAANLFAALHRADASGRMRIAIAPIPRYGLGIAINDRIARAAAPRETPQR